TAAEFEIAMNVAGVGAVHTSAMRLEDADHTFSDPERWRAVIGDTLEMLPGLADRAGCGGRAPIEGR
ncbi:MAG TPA: hypothetical protein PKC03_17585, partial [Dokdonella sp.]|nr:hypothetical protein [Dokdonella sp.]